MSVATYQSDLGYVTPQDILEEAGMDRDLAGNSFSKKLSALHPTWTLADARAAFPAPQAYVGSKKSVVRALSDELDWVLIQTALYRAMVENRSVWLPEGQYVVDRTVELGVAYAGVGGVYTLPDGLTIPKPGSAGAIKDYVFALSLEGAGPMRANVPVQSKSRQDLFQGVQIIYNGPSIVGNESIGGATGGLTGVLSLVAGTDDSPTDKRREVNKYLKIKGITIACATVGAADGLQFSTQLYTQPMLEDVVFSNCRHQILNTGEFSANGEAMMCQAVRGSGSTGAFFRTLRGQAYRQTFIGCQAGAKDGQFVFAAKGDSGGHGFDVYGHSCTLTETAGGLATLQTGLLDIENVSGPISFFGGRVEHPNTVVRVDGTSASGADSTILFEGMEFSGCSSSTEFPIADIGGSSNATRLIFRNCRFGGRGLPGGQLPRVNVKFRDITPYNSITFESCTFNGYGGYEQINFGDVRFDDCRIRADVGTWVPLNAGRASVSLPQADKRLVSGLPNQLIQVPQIVADGQVDRTGALSATQVPDPSWTAYLVGSGAGVSPSLYDVGAFPSASVGAFAPGSLDARSVGLRANVGLRTEIGSYSPGKAYFYTGEFGMAEGFRVSLDLVDASGATVYRMATFLALGDSGTQIYPRLTNVVRLTGVAPSGVAGASKVVLRIENTSPTGGRTLPLIRQWASERPDGVYWPTATTSTSIGQWTETENHRIFGQLVVPTLLAPSTPGRSNMLPLLPTPGEIALGSNGKLYCRTGGSVYEIASTLLT